MKLQALPSAGIGLKSVVYHMKLQALPSRIGFAFRYRLCGFMVSGSVDW